MSGRVLLALDAGQTGTKVRIERPGRAPVELTYPGVRTSEALTPQLSATAHALADGGEAGFEVIAVGASGLTDAATDAVDLLRLTADLGAREVHVAHDSVTSYLGSVGDAWGAVVAAGTGVVTLAVGRSQVARIDGWGNIMGDAGSAYWIGREALDAVMRSHDGRSGPTALVDVVRDHWPDIEEAYIDLQSDPDRVRIVASFAASVSALAGTDAAAAQISLRAARELSLSVSAGLRRVREPGDAPSDFVVGMVGGVLGAGAIRSRFEELIIESWPGIVLTLPHGTGLDGAVALVSLPPSHPLRGRVAVATGAE